MCFTDFFDFEILQQTVDPNMDHAVYIFWYVDLYKDRTLHIVWYVDVVRVCGVADSGSGGGEERGQGLW